MLLQVGRHRKWTILAEIKNLLLGDNPFFGVDHLSQERSRLKGQAQDFGNMLDVMDYVNSVGVHKMVVSNHPKLADFIRYSTMYRPDVLDKIEFYPIIPYVQGYVQKINEKGMLGTVMEILNQADGLQGIFKIIAKGGAGVIKKDFLELFRVFIDSELLRVRKLNIRTIFLHDVLTDLALSLNLKGVFETFRDYLHDEYKMDTGLVTKNFSRLVDQLDIWNLEIHTIMTSFNKIGFQMNPSKEACEITLSKYEGNVIAMSVLAGGYLKPRESFEYIVSLPRIESVVVGVSSVAHATDLIKILSGNNYDP